MAKRHANTRKGKAKRRRTKTLMPEPHNPHAAQRDVPPPTMELGSIEAINGLNVREYMFCFYISRCYPGRLAALEAGYVGARAAAGVTAAELMRRPEIREQIKRFVDQQISDTELDDIAAKLARGDAPTKIVEGPDGVREERDILKANEFVNRLKGRLKDQHEHSGPGGGPIPHEHAALSDDALQTRIRELERKGGLAPSQ